MIGNYQVVKVFASREGHILYAAQFESKSKEQCVRLFGADGQDVAVLKYKPENEGKVGQKGGPKPMFTGQGDTVYASGWVTRKGLERISVQAKSDAQHRENYQQQPSQHAGHPAFEDDIPF